MRKNTDMQSMLETTNHTGPVMNSRQHHQRLTHKDKNRHMIHFLFNLIYFIIYYKLIYI